MPQTAQYKFGAIHMLCAQALCVCTLKVLDTRDSHHNTTEESKKDSCNKTLHTSTTRSTCKRGCII